MTPSHERLFALGVALGAAFGFIVGSVLAMRVGDEAVESVRRVVDRVTHHDDGPRFELLLQ